MSFNGVCATSTTLDSSQRAPTIIFNTEPVAYSDTPSCTIPFSRVGNLILIKAKADSIEGNFILDTGAPYLVLNATYFRDYPATPRADAESAGVTGPVASVMQTSLGDFTLGTIKYSHVEADLVNLGHIESAKNVKILGLIGMQFLKNCEMIIDYERNLIYLHLISHKEAATYQSDFLKDASAYNVIPIELLNDKILATTEVAGKKIKFMIDCGAETSMIDSRLPDKVLADILITGRILVNGNGSKKIEALQGEVMSMKIGTDTWKSVPVIVTNMEKSCLSYESCVKGILGFDFLSLKKVGFNFVTRKMYIWK